jgi:hypothetical protein
MGCSSPSFLPFITQFLTRERLDVVCHFLDVLLVEAREQRWHLSQETFAPHTLTIVRNQSGSLGVP